MHESEKQSEVAQSCLTLSDPMDCSLPGSSVHGIFQAKVLECPCVVEICTPLKSRKWSVPFVFLGFSGVSDREESAGNAGDLGSIPGLERSPGGGKGYPLQYLIHIDT